MTQLHHDYADIDYLIRRAPLRARQADGTRAAIHAGLQNEIDSALITLVNLLKATDEAVLAERLERVYRAWPLDLESLLDRLSPPLETIITAYTSNADILSFEAYDEQLQTLSDALMDLDDWRLIASNLAETVSP